MRFQIDTWQGPWLAATGIGGNTFNATTPTLQPGVHILYAYAFDGQAATSTNAGAGSSPFVGNIAAYLFVVTPAVTTGRYTPLTPARILDTRDGTGGIAGPVGPGRPPSTSRSPAGAGCRPAACRPWP